jgi:DNA polymerase-3 subunit beta
MSTRKPKSITAKSTKKPTTPRSVKALPKATATPITVSAESSANIQGWTLKVLDNVVANLASIEDVRAAYIKQTYGVPYDQRDVGTIYRDGIPFGTITREGSIRDLSGAQLGKPTPQVPAAEPKTAEEPQDEPQADVKPLETVKLSVADLTALLLVAAKEDARFYLNGIFMHQVGDQLRMVASDGHRMLVISRDHKEAIAWGQTGVIVPRDRLDGIAKFAAKGEPAMVDMTIGDDRPHILIESTSQGASFKLQAIEGKFPDYTRIIESSTSEALSPDRDPLDGSAMNPAYLKSAGVIAKAFEADSITSFAGKDGATVMTFGGQAGVILYIMPQKGEADGGLADKTLQLIGKAGMAGSMAALKACETRARNAAKAAKSKKETDAHTAKADGYRARQQAITAALSHQLTGPTAPPAAADEEGDSTEA